MNEQTLTMEDLQILRGFFNVDEHEFDYGKNAYIKELPISERIESVDPAFSFIVKSITVRPPAGDGGKEVGTVTVHASMTIKGATRENTGMAVILKSDKKEETKWVNKKRIPTGELYTVEANQAEKSATTDAFKRCARLFGIGRYMLNFGNEVNDYHSLKRWLDKQPPNIIEMPTGDKFTPVNAKRFSDYWQTQGLNAGQVLEFLGVTRLGEWAGTINEANELLSQKVGA